MQEELAAASETTRAAIQGDLPKAAIISGSGLSGILARGKILTAIDYAEIAGMPIPTVPGHEGKLGIVEFGGRSFLCFNGRAHLYEGHSAGSLGFAVRLAAELGVSTLVPTCAVGSLNRDIRAGDLVAVTDHISMSGANPLVGIAPPDETKRFPDTSRLYTPQLVEAARAKAQELGFGLKMGTYAWVGGPSYETPAEARMLANLGAEVVGMSLVPETLTAAQLGLRVLALACVTNAAHNGGGLTSHDYVLSRAGEMVDSLASLLTELAPVLAGENP